MSQYSQVPVSPNTLLPLPTQSRIGEYPFQILDRKSPPPPPGLAQQTSNAENVIIHPHFPEPARVFTDNWNLLWAESMDYSPTD